MTVLGDDQVGSRAGLEYRILAVKSRCPRRTGVLAEDHLGTEADRSDINR